MPRLQAPKQNPWIGKDRRFEFAIFVRKAYEQDGQWYIDAVATGPDLDLQNERMSDGALEKMNAQFNSGDLPLVKTHWDSEWLDEFGYVRSGTVQEDGNILVTIWLDKTMEWTMTLWRKLQGVPEAGILPRKLGVSIGGILVLAHDEIDVAGAKVRVIDDIDLVHLAMTSQPAYPKAIVLNPESTEKRFSRKWISQIAKAWGGAGGGSRQEIPAHDQRARKTAVETDAVVIEVWDAAAARLIRQYLTKTSGGTNMSRRHKSSGGAPGAVLDEALDGVTDQLDELDELEKAEGDQPPETDTTDPAADEAENALDAELAKGSWCKASDITADHQVWAVPPGDGSDNAPPPAKSRRPLLRVSTSRAQAAEIDLILRQAARIRSLKARVQALESLADDDEDDAPPPRQVQRPFIREKGLPQPRGLRNTGRDADQVRARQTAETHVNRIAELKATERYQKASPTARQALLSECLKSRSLQR